MEKPRLPQASEVHRERGKGVKQELNTAGQGGRAVLSLWQEPASGFHAGTREFLSGLLLSHNCDVSNGVREFHFSTYCIHLLRLP